MPLDADLPTPPDSDRQPSPAGAPGASQAGRCTGQRLAPHPIPGARLVCAIDLAIVMVAFVATVLRSNIDQMPDGLEAFLAMRISVKNVLALAGLMSGALILFRWCGLYDAGLVRRGPDERRRMILATLAITAVVAVLPSLAEGPYIDQSSLTLFALGTGAALLTSRKLRAALHRGTRLRRRVIIVGTGPRAMRIHRELCADAMVPRHVLGFVDTPDSQVSMSSFVKRRLLSPLDELEAVLVAEHVDEVYVGLPVRSQYRQIQDVIRVCERLGVEALYQADIFQTELARSSVTSTAAARPQVQLKMVPEGVLLMVKRSIDIIAASTALAVLSPVMLGAALAVKLTSGGPIIYAQERFGLNRRRIRMFKFRTMVRDADNLQAGLESRNEASGPVFKIANDPRITPLGRFLRRSSIDELPQLFNVLRGDMSLVGPRPLPLRDVARFTRTGDLRRFSVRPGITGLWQVNGRSGLGFDDWIRWDLHYIDRWSLALDVSILVRTVPAVLMGTGAR